MQIALTPKFAFNPPGTLHTVTANVVNLLGSPLQNKLVTFKVLSGPNFDTTGTDTTDASGDAFFMYTGTGGVGLDVIQASFVDADLNTVVITARKYWDSDCQPNSIPDTCDLSCADFNSACAADFPGFCGTSLDTNNDLAPDECNNNAPPVAQCQDVTIPTDAGVCTAASASVDNDSFDPDGDPITLVQEPPGPYNLGDTLGVTLTVTDGDGASDSCMAIVTVEDREPPPVTAALVPYGKVKENKGRFRVEYSCNDNCDPNGTTTAKLNGIPVENGQVAELEVDNDSEIEWDHGTLEIEAPSFELVVTCEDAAGNKGMATAMPAFAPGGGDDDDDDHKKKTKKDDDDDDDGDRGKRHRRRDGDRHSRYERDDDDDDDRGRRRGRGRGRWRKQKSRNR